MRGPARDALAATALLLVAAGLRLTALEQGQFRGDEAMHLLRAAAIARGDVAPVLGLPTTDGLPTPATFHYALAGLVALVGARPYPVMVAVALLNAAAAGGLYLAARRDAGRLAAGVAGGVLAAAPGLVVSGRKVWNPDLVLPLAVAVLSALASKRASKRDLAARDAAREQPRAEDGDHGPGGRGPEGRHGEAAQGRLHGRPGQGGAAGLEAGDAVAVAARDLEPGEGPEAGVEEDDQGQAEPLEQQEGGQGAAQGEGQGGDEGRRPPGQPINLQPRFDARRPAGRLATAGARARRRDGRPADAAGVGGAPRARADAPAAARGARLGVRRGRRGERRGLLRARRGEAGQLQGIGPRGDVGEDERGVVLRRPNGPG